MTFWVCSTCVGSSVDIFLLYNECLSEFGAVLSLNDVLLEVVSCVFFCVYVRSDGCSGVLFTGVLPGFYWGSRYCTDSVLAFTGKLVNCGRTNLVFFFSVSLLPLQNRIHSPPLHILLSPHPELVHIILPYFCLHILLIFTFFPPPHSYPLHILP